MIIHEGLLKRHVVESNRIEGVRARPGHSLYDDHLQAARIAARGDIVHPNILHAKLLGHRPRWRHRAGLLRRDDVWIITSHLDMYSRRYVMAGRQRMPSASRVPELMAIYETLAEEYISSAGYDAEKAWLIHMFLLCIHPYPDGNGRTARLVWNMLRASKGLPWLIQPSRTKARYYAKIHAFEEQVFRKQYPDLYS